MNKVPRWGFCYVGNKTYDFSSKKKDFLPKNDQIWPKIGIFGSYGPGHAGFFGALLVGQLVVVARAVSRKTPIYFIADDGLREFNHLHYLNCLHCLNYLHCLHLHYV